MGSVSSIDELRSDPERLSRGSGKASLELSLLGSLQSIAVPPTAKALVWNGLVTQVAGLGAATAMGSGSWLSTWWRDALKVLATSKAAVAVPVVIAALGVGAVQYHHSAAAQPTNTVVAARAPTQPSTNAGATTAPTEVDATEVEPLLDADELPLAAPVRPRATSSLRDQLSEESALLERARAELRGGHPRAAEATLLRMQGRFPHGALTQEREVLLIQALAARGNAEAAERDARSFVAAHPESPHAVQLRRLYARSNYSATQLR